MDGRVGQTIYRQRWRIWIVAVLAHTIGMFHRAAMAPVADRIMADFNISALAFGSFAAVYSYIYCAMQLPSGAIADTIGPRKTITTGLLLSTLGSIIMGIAPSLGLLYLGRIIVSFGVSIVWLSAIKVLMGWFHSRELASIMGVSVSLAHLGQIAATTPLALLVMWIGWRVSFVTIGLVGLALAVASWLIVRDSPAHVGLPPIQKLNEQTNPQATKPPNELHLGLAQKFRIVFKNKYILPLFLLPLGTYGAYSTLFHNWAVVYLMHTYDVPRDFAANFVLISTIGLMVGGPTAGLLSDRVLKKRRLPIVLFTGLTLTCFLLLGLWNGSKPPLESLYPLCFFAGFGTSGVSISFACVGDMVQPSVRGIASGLVNTGGFVGAAIAQPLFGHILDLGWQGEMMGGARLYPVEAFQRGILLCCVLAAVSFISALLVKETHCHVSHIIEEQF